MYSRRQCESSKSYYDAIQIHFRTADFYTILSKSSTNPKVSLYEQYFHPFDPSKNLLLSNIDGCPGFQFYLRTNFLVNQTYVLVVRVDYVPKQDSIHIITSGLDFVTYNPISKFRLT